MCVTDDVCWGNTCMYVWVNKWVENGQVAVWYLTVQLIKCSHTQHWSQHCTVKCPHLFCLEVVPLEHLLRREGGKWFLPLPRHDKVVLQGVRQIVRVREVEIFGHIHELKQSHVSRLRYLRGCLIQLLVQLLPYLSECTVFKNLSRTHCKRFCRFNGVDKIRTQTSDFLLLCYQGEVVAAEKLHKSH